MGAHKVLILEECLFRFLQTEAEKKETLSKSPLSEIAPQSGDGEDLKVTFLNSELQEIYVVSFQTNNTGVGSIEILF